MTRLWSTLQLDLRLQWRNGFYYATAVILALFTLLLAHLPPDQLGRLLPVVIINNLLVNGFYFVAGLVLLEKSEGSLQAQVTTPLRDREYLASKALSLSLLSLLENGLLLLLLPVASFSWVWLALGVVAGTTFFTLAGFIAVVRFHALNEFLLPSLLVATVLALPLLAYFDIGGGPSLAALLYLHPVQAVLLALSAASGALLESWQVGYTVIFLPLATLLISRQAQSAYRRFVRQTATRAAGDYS